MQYYKWAGRMGEAIAYGEQALALARELNLREQLAYALNDISSAYVIDGQIQRARALLEEARQLWRELGVLNMLADSLASSAEMHVLGGEYDQALALSREALSVSQTIGNVWNQSYSWYMIDLVYLDRGEIAKAIEAAEECLRLARLAGFVPGIMQSLFDLALIYGDLGAVQRGYEVAELFRSAMSEMPLLGLFGGVMEARLHLSAGQLAAARSALVEARRDVDRDALPAYMLLFFNLVDAEVHMGAGDYARVLALADEALPFLREAGIRLFLTDALYFKGRALLALKRVDEGRDILRDARVLAEAIGSRRTLWRILAALSEIEAGRGNRSEAEGLRRQAAGVIDFIVDHCPPELRASFLHRSDVRNMRSEA
jgi:tetratricopeptide (TPR) repeat protein